MLKKKPLKMNSILKEDHFAMMNKYITGTSLSFDLNTPDIKFEDFAFTDRTLNSSNDSTMEVEHSLAPLDTAVHADNSIAEDCLSIEASTSGDAYTLFDMSPGSRDILQSDQLEQRISIQEFSQGQDDDFAINTTNIPSIPELDFGFLPHTGSFSGNGLEAVSFCQPHAVEVPPQCNSPPQLSLDDDLNFTIPDDLLKQMESLFPEEHILATNTPVANDVSSTELDMYLGTHCDLLSGALVQSGLLDDDLDAFNVEENGQSPKGTLNSIMLPFNLQIPGANTVAATVNSCPEQSEQPACLITNPQAFLNNPGQQTNPQAFLNNPGQQTNPQAFFNNTDHHSDMVTPTPSTSCTTFNQNPSKKRFQQVEVTPTTESIKRRRRTAKKPLRFRDIVIDTSDDEKPKVKVTESVAENTQESNARIKEEEPENLHTTDSKKCARPTQNLTEEEKYHRIRELNNEASRRCRQKRKTTIKGMAGEMVILEERNAHLKKKRADLEQLRDKFQAFVNDYFRQRLASSK